MRQIGSLSNVEQADLLADFLLSQGIKCHLDQTDSGYVLWALDDDQLAAAKAHFQTFTTNPSDPRFVEGARAARSIRQEELARKRQFRKNVIDLRPAWSLSQASGPAVVTNILLATCIAVGFLTGLGQPGNDVIPLLMFSTDFDWSELKAGEVWRLVTPILLHFGLMHLLFNGMWLYDLGPMIERRKGSGWLILFVLLVAIGSNTAQAYFVSPAFGGFSGVNYGLIGYAFIRGRFAPFDGISLSKQSAVFAIVWMLLGIGGEFMGHNPWMANWAHGVGFVMGCGWAGLEYTTRRLLR
jgi:GlpG protein